MVADAEGRLSYVGASSWPILDRRPEALLGTSGRALPHPDGLDRIRVHGLASHDREGTTYRFRGRDGAYRWLLCRTGR